MTSQLLASAVKSEPKPAPGLCQLTRASRILVTDIETPFVIIPKPPLNSPGLPLVRYGVDVILDRKFRL